MFQKASKVIIWLLMVVGMICVAMPVQAGVTAEEAARLKNDLTPLGAERAGNTEGTIPAWEGGLTGIPPGISYDPNKGLPLPDPFAAEPDLPTAEFPAGGICRVCRDRRDVSQLQVTRGVLAGGRGRDSRRS